MAERRMFAKTIIDSDAFLDMPHSTQLLYFHLSMRADDEGFLNNPRKISKTIGASEDDMKILLAKKFVLAFESGIIVIKHWKIHNYIRGDRLAETKYTKEKSLLSVSKNGIYSLMEGGSLIKIDIPSNEKRKIAYANSSLPYSFEYKIRTAFWGKLCPICNSKMEGDREFGARNRIPTIQHCIPISKGGEHELGNIAVICKSCNISIQDKETKELNSQEVIDVWEDIVSQMSVKCQSNVSIGKVRLGKVSKETTTTTAPAENPEIIEIDKKTADNTQKDIELPKTEKKSKKGTNKLPKEELELTSEEKKPKALTPQQVSYEYFKEKYERRTGFKFCSAKSDFVILTGLCEQFGIDVVKQKIEFLEMAIVKNIEGTNLYWFAKDFTDFTIGKLKHKWNEIIPKLTKDQIDELNRKSYFENKEKEKKGVV